MEKAWQKVLFCTFQNGDPNVVACARDMESGTILMTYKGGSCSQKTLTLVNNEYIIGADEYKPLIYVWALNKKDPVQRIRTTGIVRAMCISPTQLYLVGAVEEKLYVWMVSTGQLLLVVDHHMSRVTCLHFSTDRHVFMSGDEQGVVAVWSLQSLLTSSAHALHPLSVLNIHSSSITAGLIINDVIITSSRDNTVKVSQLDTRKLIHDWLFECQITCLAGDVMGRFLAVGLQDGSIRLKDTWEKSVNFTKLWTKSPISCLAVAADADRLLSGSHEGEVKMWDMMTGTCVASITHKGQVNDMRTCTLKDGWNEQHFKPLSPFYALQFQLSDLTSINILPNTRKQTRRSTQELQSTSSSSSSSLSRLEDLENLRAINRQLFNKLVHVVMER